MSGEVIIIRSPMTRKALQDAAGLLYGELIKVVVDVDREIMAIGGELHADEEQVLLTDGSRQQDLWGINVYPGRTDESWLKYDSMINLRPSQGNRSRGVDDPAIRERILLVVKKLVV